MSEHKTYSYKKISQYPSTSSLDLDVKSKVDVVKSETETTGVVLNNHLLTSDQSQLNAEDGLNLDSQDCKSEEKITYFKKAKYFIILFSSVSYAFSALAILLSLSASLLAYMSFHETFNVPEGQERNQLSIIAKYSYFSMVLSAAIASWSSLAIFFKIVINIFTYFKLSNNKY